MTAIAALLLAVPWTGMLDFDFGRVEVDRITTSAVVVMTLTLFFSMASWSLLSWASKSIDSLGLLASIITGMSLVMPFMGVLGPMAAVIVGIVAGFSAFMLQKWEAYPARQRHGVTAFGTLASAYLVLFLLVLSVQSPPIWDAGDGVGSWSGTAQGIEEHGFVGMDGIGFAYFVIIVPALVATRMVLRRR